MFFASAPSVLLLVAQRSPARPEDSRRTREGHTGLASAEGNRRTQRGREERVNVCKCGTGTAGVRERAQRTRGGHRRPEDGSSMRTTAGQLEDKKRTTPGHRVQGRGQRL